MERIENFNQTNGIEDQDRSKGPREPRPRGLLSQHSNGKQGTKSHTMKCFNCGRSNHLEKECRSKCKICGASQHTRYSCPDKKSKRKTNNSATQNKSNTKDNYANLASSVESLKATVETLLDRKFDSEEVVGFGGSAICLLGGKQNTTYAKTTRDMPKLDSGCNIHSFGSKTHFKKGSLKTSHGQLQVANGVKCPIVGEGKVGKHLKNVKLVQGLEHDLVSIGQLCDDGKEITFNSKECTMRDITTGRSQTIGTRVESGLYEANRDWLYDQEYIGSLANHENKMTLELLESEKKTCKFAQGIS